tara:strand:+ start:566 stop:1921 length:1356 start_codon:yes stop_codon:yes gene_type:complete
MFKKIEIWILYLFILLSIPVTVFFGVLVRQELEGQIKLGGVSKSALFLSEIPKNLKKAFLDILQVEDRFPSLGGFQGNPNSNESYLLLSRYDGALKEGIIELVDLTNFNVLHTWNPDIDKFNKSIKKTDEFKNLIRDKNNARQLLFHPNLTRDGGLLFYSAPLRKIDACSNLIYQINHDWFHFSIEIDSEGNIWVPSHIYPQSLSREKVGRGLLEDKGFRDDAILKLSPEGKIIFEKSISQILIDNGLEYLIFGVGDQDHFNSDPIHLNDIQPVEFDGEFWKKGDVFLSLRNQSMVLLYRPSSNKIIWKGTGPFFQQHDVDILNESSISIFNNNTKKFESGSAVDGNSEVIIYNFTTDKYSSYQNESFKENDVRTLRSGRSQILPDGNLFVEETNSGRILYFESDGSLRWTFVNRAKNDKVYLLAWSRILYNDMDIMHVNNFLKTRGKCND